MSDNIEDKVKKLVKQFTFYFNTVSKNANFDIKYELFINDNSSEIRNLYVLIESTSYWDGDSTAQLAKRIDDRSDMIFNFFQRNNFVLTKWGDFVKESKVASPKNILNVMGPVLYKMNYSIEDNETLVMGHEVIFTDD
jgi:hypothetical protein